MSAILLLPRKNFTTKCSDNIVKECCGNVCERAELGGKREGPGCVGVVGGGGGGFGLVMRERLEESRGMGRTGGRWKCGHNGVVTESGSQVRDKEGGVKCWGAGRKVKWSGGRSSVGEQLVI